MQNVHTNNIRRAAIYWLLTIAYMGLIFFLSSQNSVNLPRLITGMDKIVHVLAYIPMAFLFFLSINESGIKKYVFLAAFLCASLYGITDEIHQSFTPGRDPSIGDVIADCLGALIGCLTANFVKFRTNLT